QQVQQRLDGARNLRSRRPTPDPTNQAGPVPRSGRRLHRRDHRRCGSTHRSHGNAGAALWAGTTWRHESFRSAIRPIAGTRRAPDRALARPRAYDTKPGAPPSHCAATHRCPEAEWRLSREEPQGMIAVLISLLRFISFSKTRFNSYRWARPVMNALAWNRALAMRSRALRQIAGVW